jgi:hypothetical protein
MGGAPGGDTQTALQQHGETARNTIKGANDAAKQREEQLWRAVDPNGSLTVGTDRLRNGAAQIRQEMAQNDKPMAGEEKQIFDLAQGQPEVQSFREIQALRSRLLAAMREERFANGSSRRATVGRALAGAAAASL